MKVIIAETEREILIRQDENIYQALLREDIILKSSCGGYGACGECIVKVVDYDSKLMPRPGHVEQKWLGNVFHLTRERLSCQINGIGIDTIDCTLSLRR